MMNYAIYKLAFSTGVHFGSGLLNDSETFFRADSLFSALYQEALKLWKESLLLQMTKQGNLRFSNAFPYVGDTYLLPKPMVYVENSKKTDPGERKLYKKLMYLPVEKIKEFLGGQLNIRGLNLAYGSFEQLTKAAVRTGAETLPYQVGIFRFAENCGLYVICCYADAKEKECMDLLMDSLSYTGIGGKRSAGLGKFEVLIGKKNEALEALLTANTGRFMLLSNALPQDGELDKALEGADYLLDKRSGFVDSAAYAPELLRKRDLYTFRAGSCFRTKFEGDIFHVETEGAHPVYRYAKALWVGISV